MDAEAHRRTSSFDFDLAEAKQILDARRLQGHNGDGIREMPGGGKPLRLRYAVRSRVGDRPTGRRVRHRVAEGHRDRDDARRPTDDSQLTEVIGKGDYDLFVWGWTPFVDPDPMLSYFTCGQVSQDPKDPTNYYNDASWCDKTYGAMYEQQNVELDPAKRRAIVQQMLTRFYEPATYVALYTSPTCRPTAPTSTRAGSRQPAETGPVLFYNSSPTYANLAAGRRRPRAGGGGGGSARAIIAIVVAAVVVLGGAGLLIARRRSADERE